MKMNSHLIKVVFFLFSFFFLFSCRNDRNREKLKTIIPICNQGLFVEKYEVWGGGAYGGDMISAYLTDSTNFRKYLRTYDNDMRVLRLNVKEKTALMFINKYWILLPINLKLSALQYIVYQSYGKRKCLIKTFKDISSAVGVH